MSVAWQVVNVAEAGRVRGPARSHEPWVRARARPLGLVSCAAFERETPMQATVMNLIVLLPWAWRTSPLSPRKCLPCFTQP
jgi:hypothetical protein